MTRQMRLVVLLVFALLVAPLAGQASQMAARLHAAIVAAGVAITSVSIGRYADKATWKVTPATLQAAAQPIIDAFNPDDPAHVQAELATQATAALDTERLTSAVVWTVLKQMFPADTEAQTRTKFAAARTQIIAAFSARPWVAP